MALAKRIGKRAQQMMGDATAYPFLRADQPVPFEELLAPAVCLARERLQTVAREDEVALLSESALGALQRALLLRLLRAAHDPLFLEWAVHCAMPSSASSRSARGTGPRDGASRYRAFVAAQRADGLATLFTRYPVIARLWVVMIDDWVRSTTTLLRRLRRDWDTLRRELFPGLPEKPAVGAVCELKAGMSDPHADGATVLALTLRHGGCVIYKPRALDPDRAYFRLLVALNRCARGLPQQRVVKVLCRRDRDGGERSIYGWMESVSAAPVSDTAAVRRYYRRAGALVCLHYCLRAVDGHEENWIAAGEQPVCVDLETCAYPASAAEPAIADTVLRTGTLPFPGYNVAPFGTTQRRRSLLKQRCWRAINRDAMWVEEACVRYRANVLPSALRLRSNGVAVNASRYRAEMVRGFEQMAEVLRKNAAARAAFRRCVAELSDAKDTLRWLPRPTSFYNALLARLSRIDCLQNEARFQTVLRAELSSEHNETVRSSERRALERFTIPRLTQSASDRGHSGGRLDDIFDRPDFVQDIRHQCQVLTEALTPTKRRQR